MRVRKVAQSEAATPKARTTRVLKPSPSAVALTVRLAAERYSVTEKFIRARIYEGTLPAAKPAGVKAYLIRIADLDALFAPKVRAIAPRPETEDEAAERQLRAVGIA